MKEKSRILVLGAGHIGRAMAIDLKKSGHRVTVADRDNEVLGKLQDQYQLDTVESDFKDQTGIRNLVKDYDLVVGAAPGHLGYKLMQWTIGTGTDMVDISFCPEDYMELDRYAKEKEVILITDMGVAPGLCNLICGYHNEQMQIDNYKCMVGGLPVKREWPLEYKSSWSPIDCIEEYIRPARMMEHGKVSTRPALSDPEIVNLEPVGSLEAWNSDGLRSLLRTMKHIPDMVEKTLRYPGTTEYMKVLRELGFFSYDPVVADGKKIRPVDVTAALLFPAWQLKPGEKEFTIMQVIIEGNEKDKPVRVVYDLYDEYDPETGTTSMARTTGYTCTAAVNLVLRDQYTRKGVSPPEYLGTNPEHFEFIMDYLKERGVRFKVLKI